MTAAATPTHEGVHARDGDAYLIKIFPNGNVIVQIRGRRIDFRKVEINITIDNAWGEARPTRFVVLRTFEA